MCKKISSAHERHLSVESELTREFRVRISGNGRCNDEDPNRSAIRTEFGWNIMVGLGDQHSGSVKGCGWVQMQEPVSVERFMGIDNMLSRPPSWRGVCRQQSRLIQGDSRSASYGK